MHIVGIDVGTYASSVAVSVRGHATIIADPRGAQRTPSVVAIAKHGKRLVGQAAKHQVALNPENTVVGAKRLLGRSWNSPETTAVRQRVRFALQPGSRNDVRIWLRDRACTPAEICAVVVDRLKCAAEAYLDSPVKEVVFGIPAHFDEPQQAAMAAVGSLLGLEVVDLVPEPVAAVLAYDCTGGQRTIAVYDMGATCECTIVRVDGDEVQLVSSAYELFLGGEAFDSCIVDWLAGVLAEERGFDLLGEPLALQRVLDAAEGVKAMLSRTESATIELPLIDPTAPDQEHGLSQVLTRELFEELIAELVEHSIEVCQLSVERAGILPTDVDEVLLVGAQTATPALRRAVADFFGREPLESIHHPRDVVCLGVALWAERVNNARQPVASTEPPPPPVEKPTPPPPPPLENRRQHERQPVVLKVDYPSRGDFLTDYTLNISQGGLNLCTDQEMTVGEHLQLQLSFPTLVSALTVEAMVRWVGDGELAGESVVGLELVGEGNDFSDLVSRIAAQDPALVAVARKPYILVVEESPQLALMIEKELADASGRATAVAREVQGALLLLNEEFDVLVVDVSLPNLQGEALIRAVRSKPRWASLPIVAVGEGDRRATTMEAGVDFFLQRPVRLPMLVETLRDLLQATSAGRC